VESRSKDLFVEDLEHMSRLMVSLQIGIWKTEFCCHCDLPQCITAWHS